LLDDYLNGVSMSEYFAKINWTRANDENFIDNNYSRGHEWSFDGGVIVQASSSPHIVPLPYSVEANVDPEEAFIASLSSCHMLFFLSVAAKRRYVVDSYLDNAIGIMKKDEDGNVSMTKVTLRPHVQFSGEKKPTLKQLEKMHHQSHEQCFLANSVKTDIITEIIV
jgi:organic hydroperoxide reductase OsmC/OhrA